MRHLVRVHLPFHVQHASGSYDGCDLSLGGFAIPGCLAAEQTVDREGFVLTFPFVGYNASLQVTARRVYGDRAEPRSGYQICDIDEHQTEVLRRLIRAHLAGQILTVDGLIKPLDPQTKRTRQSPRDVATAERLPGKKRWGRRAAYSVFVALAIVTAGTFAVAAFERLAIVRAEFAAVTAPKLDVLAPANGQLSYGDLLPDGRIARDTLLGKIADPDLAAGLAQARSRHAYTDQLLNIISHQTSGDEARVAEGLDLNGKADLPLTDERIPVDAANRVDTLRARADLNRAALAALEVRTAANSLVSPCDCTVTWSAGDGAWVRTGEPVFTLVRTRPRDVQVEALVPLRSVERIRDHGQAFVRLSGSDSLTSARITLVAVNGEHQPRAGFPEWAAQRPDLARIRLSPTTTIPADAVGRPAEVFFSNTPGLTRILSHASDSLRGIWRKMRTTSDPVNGTGAIVGSAGP